MTSAQCHFQYVSVFIVISNVTFTCYIWCDYHYCDEIVWGGGVVLFFHIAKCLFSRLCNAMQLRIGNHGIYAGFIFHGLTAPSVVVGFPLPSCSRQTDDKLNILYMQPKKRITGDNQQSTIWEQKSLKTKI